MKKPWGTKPKQLQEKRLTHIFRIKKRRLL